MKRGRALLAATLSGIFPGLGQLANREPLRALVFFAAGLVTGFGPLAPWQVPIDPADPAPGLQRALLETLPFLAIALWSVVDAYRRAPRGDPSSPRRRA